ncbi:MAG: PKD domain-containing protein [Saprospiraceae bacterium]|nr:PKD domain-containing protein [Saprospiraceae bacterium]
MKWIYIALFNITLVFSIEAQKHDYQWLLGQLSQTNITHSGTTIDFNVIPYDIYHEFRGMHFRQANTSMCDTAGNLLFYTNGIYIANVLHEPMENGEGLAAGPAGVHNQGTYGYILDQGVMALPWPEQDSLYCVILMDKEATPSQNSFQSSNVYFAVVNMNKNNGLGTVTKKNEILISDALNMGKLTAVKHSNGRDWWVLSRRYDTNQYYKIMLTPGGFNVSNVQVIGSAIPSQSIGQAVFSPDGTKHASVHLTGGAGDPIYVSIFDFDRCSGELSNPVQFTYADTAWCGGIAISPNSRFLYVSSFRYVYQYDLHAADIEASRITVAEWDGFHDPLHPALATTFYLAQLGPDGKIYINSNTSTRYLHVINHPDSLGLACDVCQHCVELPTFNSFSLPNFPNYRLHHLEGSPCDTLRQPPMAEWVHEPLGLEIGFQDASFHDIRAWYWSFGDGAVDTVPNPVHSYAAEGVYNVCLAVSNPRGVDTLCRELQVLVSSAGAAAGSGLRMEVWPNPVPPGVPATLMAEGIAASEVGITLRDALGRTVWQQSAQVVNGRIRQDLDVSGLAAGVYFVELVSDEGMHLSGGKLVIVH